MSLSRSKIFLFCLLSFVAGVGATSLWAIDLIYLYGGLLSTVAALVVFWRNRTGRLTAIWGLFFVLGAMRLALSQPSQDNPERISFYNGQEMELAGTVSQEPDVRLDSQRLTVSVITSPPKEDEAIPLLNHGIATLPRIKYGVARDDIRGRLLVKTSLYPQYRYGDLLKIKCRLQAPEPIEDFAYDKYLARYDIYSLCYRPQIVKIASGRGNPMLSAVLKVKTRFLESLNRALPEPHSALLAGILIGARRGIPEYLLDAFNRVGVTHIIAISGANITIIAAAILSILQFWGASRRFSFWFLSAGIFVFVLMTGASASVVRAAVMAMLVLLARRLGRASRPTNALVFTAFAMLFINPKILVFDAGFQLSFLATAGIVYINPILERATKAWPKAFGFKDALFATVSAIIATAPLILYQFGRLSLVAPLANLLIVPFVPLVMAVGFAIGIAGLLWSWLGVLVGYMVWLLLEYIIRVAQGLSRLPLASLDWGGFHWLLALALYGVMGWGVWRITKKPPSTNLFHE